MHPGEAPWPPTSGVAFPAPGPFNPGVGGTPGGGGAREEGNEETHDRPHSVCFLQSLKR